MGVRRAPGRAGPRRPPGRRRRPGGDAGGSRRAGRPAHGSAAPGSRRSSPSDGRTPCRATAAKGMATIRAASPITATDAPTRRSPPSAVVTSSIRRPRAGPGHRPRARRRERVPTGRCRTRRASHRANQGPIVATSASTAATRSSDTRSGGGRRRPGGGRVRRRVHRAQSPPAPGKRRVTTRSPARRSHAVTHTALPTDGHARLTVRTRDGNVDLLAWSAIHITGQAGRSQSVFWKF